MSCVFCDKSSGFYLTSEQGKSLCITCVNEIKGLNHTAPNPFQVVSK